MIYRNYYQWFKKYDFEINAALEYTQPLNKRRIGNAKNLINAAAFNRVNTVGVCCKSKIDTPFKAQTRRMTSYSYSREKR